LFFATIYRFKYKNYLANTSRKIDYFVQQKKQLIAIAKTLNRYSNLY